MEEMMSETAALQDEMSIEMFNEELASIGVPQTRINLCSIAWFPRVQDAVRNNICTYELFFTHFSVQKGLEETLQKIERLCAR